MIKNSANYLQEHAAGTDAHMGDALVRGCKAVLRGQGGMRGGLGDLAAAISQHVSIPGILTIAVLQKQSAALRTQGIDISFYDAEGRDVELRPVSEI